MSAPAVGVLALQGDFEAHCKALAECGVAAREVRMPEALEGLSGLVLPGGESTTLLRLLREYGFVEAIPRFASQGGAIFGTCAGAILLARGVRSPDQWLARGVRSPDQWSFGMLDIDVERNAYGRQIDSFETQLTAIAPEVRDAIRPAIEDGAGAPLPAVFIRAPRILRVGEGVSVLASHKGEPVLARAGRLLVATFHPELTDDRRVHWYFSRLMAYSHRP